MDGHPNKKTKNFMGVEYSDTRYYICKWLEKELPNVSGAVINIGAGGWSVPYSLLNKNKILEYKTFDKKFYGKNKNKVNFFGDIQCMDASWTSRWDVILCIEVIECVPDLTKAFGEMYRILKPNGVLLLSCPFNYRWFGDGSWEDSKKNLNGVTDYWRPTKQGLVMLTKQFTKTEVIGFGGSGDHDRFVHCVKAIK
jgi:SAM-dependent methyltransferase